MGRIAVLGIDDQISIEVGSVRLSLTRDEARELAARIRAFDRMRQLSGDSVANAIERIEQLRLAAKGAT